MSRQRPFRKPVSLASHFNAGEPVPDWLLAMEPAHPVNEFENDMKFLIDVAVVELEHAFVVHILYPADMGKPIIGTDMKGVKIFGIRKSVILATAYQAIGVASGE